VQHLDPDRLVLLALAEGTADESEAAHLAGCAACQTELDALQHVADLGAETQGLADLPRPPDRVWSASAAATTAKPVSVRAIAPANRRRPRWLAPVLSATAAAILAIAGTVTVIRLNESAPSVTAKAALAPLPDAPPNAQGDARVLDNGELGIDVSHLPLTTGYYEVWLIDPDNTKKMVSIGNLPDRANNPVVVLPIPPGTDLNTYRLVDVSAEAHDGNSAHSGKSLLRGTLTN